MDGHSSLNGTYITLQMVCVSPVLPTNTFIYVKSLCHRDIHMGVDVWQAKDKDVNVVYLEVLMSSI